MGRDHRDTGSFTGKMYFNPRAPHGARREIGRLNAVAGGKFQSTRPAWGATWLPCPFHVRYVISIHAPRMGRDSKIVQNI